MRLVGCLLLPTDIRACLYEPGMGEGRVQAWIQTGSWPGQPHHSGQTTGPLVVMKTSGCHRVVHRYRLIRQHRHSTQYKNFIPVLQFRKVPAHTPYLISRKRSRCVGQRINSKLFHFQIYKHNFWDFDSSILWPEIQHSLYNVTVQ